MTDPNPGTPPADGGTPPAEQPKGNEPPKFTPEQQKHIDDMLQRRLRESNDRLNGEVERRVQEQVERSKMDAAQRAEAERDEARQKADEATKGSRRAIAEARVETALLAAGVKPERVEKVARLVALDDVAASDDPKAAAGDAVRQVLADFPEFRPVVGQSGGEMGGGGGGGTVTLDQFRKMDADQLLELDRKDPALFARLSAQDLGPE